MKGIALLFYALAYLGAFAFGVRYLLTREYMPYHAQVTGKAWGQLDHGSQIVFTGLMRVVAGGLLGVALAGLWLTWLLWNGASLPFLLTPLPGLVAGAVALWAGLTLRQNGGVGAPVAQVGALVGIALLGILLMLVAG